MKPEELVQSACPKVGSIGAAFYFDPATLAKGKELGLDGFRFYILGRGGVLGDVDSAVVASAFGYFNPETINKMWTSAQEKLAPREAGRIYMDCVHNLGRAKFAGLENLDAFNAAAQKVNAATDPSSLALYAAINAEPLAEDAPARAMQLVAVLREYRGSAHLAAIRVTGLAAEVAHAIHRPNDVGTFGWAEAPEITEWDQSRYTTACELTDKMVTPAYAALDADEAQTFLAGLQAMEAALAQG